MKYLFLMLFMSLNAGADEWLCTAESSQRVGNIIKSCGVGIGADEDSARSQALDHAKKEFQGLCSASDDCKGYQITVRPARTTCALNNDYYKCYRMVVFAINNGTGTTDMGNVAMAKKKPMRASDCFKLNRHNSYEEMDAYNACMEDFLAN